MGGLRRAFWRLINVIHPDREEANLKREVASHLRLLEDDYRRRGLSADDAYRSARLAFGGIDHAKELHRDARAFRWLDDARRDAAYAVRMLRRHPVATAAAVLSLALGVGLNAAVFSVVDWVLVRPLPYPAPHELVRVFTAGTVESPGPSALSHALIHDEFVAFGDAAAFRASAAFTTTTRVIASAGIDPAHVVVARVSGDLFATLAVDPDVGRGFSGEELAAGAPVVVLAHHLWQRAFARDLAIVGRTVLIDGAPHTVVGIMPVKRGYPADAEVWRPLTADERADDDRELHMVARLQREMPVARASAEIATLARGVSNGTRDAWVENLQRTDVSNVSAALTVLFTAAMLTLLIACVNIAALVGARSEDRAGEMAIRGALGATRARVLKQLVCESLVLALAGGAFGLLIGRWALAALVAIAPVSLPRLEDIALDARILSVGLVTTLITGLAVGLAPGLRLSRVTETAGVRRLGWHRATSTSRARHALVLAQVAIAVVLTAGAGLLTRSLQHLMTTEHGFAADELVSADLYLRGSFGGDSRQLFSELIEQTKTVPGVASVAVSMRLPTQVIGLRAPVQVLGEADALSSPATLRPISPGYFETAGIPVVSGRAFSAADTEKAPRVAIVNTAFVRELLGGRAAVGLRLTRPSIDAPTSIVGVVGDVTPAGEPDRPALYVPVEQVSIGGGYLLVRTDGDPRAILSALTNRLRTAAPNLAMDRVRRVAETLEAHRAVTRFATQVTATFAGLALLLSIIGVYGLTASDMVARWRELAIRLAVGASHWRAFWTVIRPCAVVLVIGAMLGVLGALSAGPALASLLHGVGRTDVWALGLAPMLLLTSGALAAVLAARRVLQADPSRTLRSE
jgi:putative ABC transport system permease protein